MGQGIIKIEIFSTLNYTFYVRTVKAVIKLCICTNCPCPYWSPISFTNTCIVVGLNSAVVAITETQFWERDSVYLGFTEGRTFFQVR